jgi:hypothetical protein
MHFAARLALPLIIAGCCPTPERPPYVATTRPVSTGLPAPVVDPLLFAAVVPPIGWVPDPPKVGDDHRHQVWISPHKSTAYGVIVFKLPFPVGPSLALWGVLREMKNKEGEANLLDRRDDPVLPGIRFVAEGGRYAVHGNLTTDGLRGWVVYAGTLRAKPVDEPELKLAEQAREATRVGVPARP